MLLLFLPKELVENIIYPYIGYLNLLHLKFDPDLKKYFKAVRNQDSLNFYFESRKLEPSVLYPVTKGRFLDYDSISKENIDIQYQILAKVYLIICISTFDGNFERGLIRIQDGSVA